jgi:hypothetical protein
MPCLPRAGAWETKASRGDLEFSSQDHIAVEIFNTALHLIQNLIQSICFWFNLRGVIR